MKSKNKNNASCIICGKGYHLCMACDRTKNTWEQWKMIADTEVCYDIYKVLNDYTFNKITKKEAKNLLEGFDLKDLDSYKESVKMQIKEIKGSASEEKVEKNQPLKEVVKENEVKNEEAEVEKKASKKSLF